MVGAEAECWVLAWIWGEGAWGEVESADKAVGFTRVGQVHLGYVIIKYMGRPKKLSEAERRKRNRERVEEWRRKNPERWREIYKRAYRKKKEGVKVELVL